LRPPQPAQPIFEPERTAWEGQATLFQPDRLALLGKAIHRGDLTQAEAEWVRVKAEPGAGALSPALEQLRQRVEGRVEPTDIGRQMRYSELSRADVRRRLANALDVDDRNALRDLALAGDLDDMVELSEEATHRIVATLAISHLEHALEIDDDILIMQAWDQSLFADGAVISETQRLRVDLAIERRAWLGQVRVALRKRDVDHIDDLMQMMPTTADSRLTDRERLRIQRMRDQRQAIADLRRAVFREQDGEVVQALHTVERLGAPIPEDMPWQEITSVVNRYALLAAIRKVVENPPLDLVRLATLLPQLKDANGGVYPNLGPAIDFDHLDLMVKRAAQITRLRESIRKGNDRSIVTTAFPDLYDVIPALDRSEQATIERAVAAVNRALRRSGQVGNKTERSSETELTTISGAAASNSE
ncbi:MAG TPA: hypothetical protein PK819_07210, partial [Thermomicrobiales bacterium]|nr:hypothetical protein [Thermomicrobiales bacterium]